MNNIELSKRILGIRKRKGLSQTQFAKELGLKNNTIISQYEKGVTAPSNKILLLIAQTFDVDYFWLITGKNTNDPKEIFNAGFNMVANANAKRNIVPLMRELKMRVFPIVSRISAGPVKEYYINIDPEKAICIPYKHDNCVAMQVDGDSMANKIDSGDIILIDLYKNIKDGDIVAVALKNGEQLIKRFKRIDGMIVLYSDNSKYRPITVNESEIEAIKKVVKIIKDV